MKKFTSIAALVMAVQVLGSGAADAAYLFNNDLTINLLPGSGIQVPGELELGSEMFDLQEGVHDTITDVTGISVDHSYIWVEVDGTPVLAVDPPSPMF